MDIPQYLSERTIRYVEASHRHMRAAHEKADSEHGNCGAIIVKDDNILGEAWGNERRDCISEAIMLAAQHEDTRGATMYVWGLWHIPNGSWVSLREAFIDDVVLVDDCERRFNPRHPEYSRSAV